MDPKISKELLESALGEKLKKFEITKVCGEFDFPHSESFEIKANFPGGGDSKFLLLKLPNISKVDETTDQNNGEKKADSTSGSFSKMFWKELNIYSILLPEFQTLIEDEKSGIKLPITPLVKAQKKPKIEDQVNSFILLEDIQKTSGFRKSSDRLLDFDHCALVIKSTADIHSLSWIYKKRNGLVNLIDKFDFLNEIIYTGEVRPMFEGMLKKSLEKFVNTLEVNLGSSSPVLNAVKSMEASKLTDHLYMYTTECENKLTKLDNLLKKSTFKAEEYADQDYWTMLCHSDIWQYNLLFHYDEKSGKPDQTKICEFLIANEQSPLNDLAYFFYLSTNHQVKVQIPQLLKIYHDRFLENVKIYKTELPKGFADFKNFSRRFRTYKYFGFLCALTWFPLIFDKDKDEKKPSADSDGKTENGKSMEEFTKMWENTECAEGRLGEWFVKMAKELYDEGII